jgi:hypothetical protein
MVGEDDVSELAREACERVDFARRGRRRVLGLRRDVLPAEGAHQGAPGDDDAHHAERGEEYAQAVAW